MGAKNLFSPVLSPEDAAILLPLSDISMPAIRTSRSSSILRGLPASVSSTFTTSLLLIDSTGFRHLPPDKIDVPHFLCFTVELFVMGASHPHVHIEAEHFRLRKMFPNLNRLFDCSYTTKFRTIQITCFLVASIQHNGQILL